MDKNTPDVRAGFLPDRVSVDTAVIPQIFAVLRHDFAINSVLLLVLLHLLYWPCSSMEGSKLGGCFHLPAPCTLNIYKYICEEKCCKGLCTSSSLTTHLHSRVSVEWFVYKWRSSLLQSMLGRTVGGRDHRCCLLGAALGGVSLWIWKLWEVSCWWRGPKEHYNHQAACGFPCGILLCSFSCTCGECCKT